MANGLYDIQIKGPATDQWKNDLRMCMMGRDFARGAFFALRGLNGGGFSYRLIKRKPGVIFDQIKSDDDFEILDEYQTGKIRVN